MVLLMLLLSSSLRFRNFFNLWDLNVVFVTLVVSNMWIRTKDLLDLLVGMSMTFCFAVPLHAPFGQVCVSKFKVSSSGEPGSTTTSRSVG